MSGRLFGDSKNCTMLLKNLMDSVKEVQNVYGKNKTLLATEKDARVQRMCTNWESALSHGLKTTSVFKNIVSGNLKTDSPTTSFWEFAFNHLTNHEKERFSTLRYVYTDHGKVRSLIRAALNERALERYISVWLSDTAGLSTYFESWALIRDNEASNLLPSIAAGLGSILFAVTVDSPELNVSTLAESVSPRQTNEIIIAVPTVSSSTERRSVAPKKAAVISFEEDDNSSLANNIVLSSSTPPTCISLADACLKYQEKQKLAEEKSKPFTTDSTYERLHAEPINIVATNSRTLSNETDYVEPEFPTSIKMIKPVQTQTYPLLSNSNSYDYKETESNQSKATDSSSVTSNTTTNSSNSSPNQATSQPSNSTSMSSSISSSHNSPNTTSSIEENDEEHDEDHDNEDENKNESRIQELTTSESEHIARIRELEQRCALLEDRVTALTLENTRLKSVHHNLVMSRQSSKHFMVSIPRVLLQRRDDVNKKYFAYEIQITPVTGENEKWSLLRRYSEFHRMDKYLQMSNPMIKTLDFPPKKSFGNMNADFVEMRRQRLQVYLLGVLSMMPEISRCTTRSQLEQAFPFFKQSHRL